MFPWLAGSEVKRAGRKPSRAHHFGGVERVQAAQQSQKKTLFLDFGGKKTSKISQCKKVHKPSRTYPGEGGVSRKVKKIDLSTPVLGFLLAYARPFLELSWPPLFHPCSGVLALAVGDGAVGWGGSGRVGCAGSTTVMPLQLFEIEFRPV